LAQKTIHGNPLRTSTAPRNFRSSTRGTRIDQRKPHRQIDPGEEGVARRKTNTVSGKERKEEKEHAPRDPGRVERRIARSNRRRHGSRLLTLLFFQHVALSLKHLQGFTLQSQTLRSQTSRGCQGRGKIAVRIHKLTLRLKNGLGSDALLLVQVTLLVNHAMNSGIVETEGVARMITRLKTITANVRIVGSLAIEEVLIFAAGAP
jgi:hypothetical protein